jgi:mRNA-degrading endonuclease toxin of MazEF toxin-antitoxin module
VLRVLRRVGFGGAAAPQQVVVVQPDALNAIAPTLLVVPLDTETGAHAADATVVRVSAVEAAARAPQVALPMFLHYAYGDRFAPGVVARLRPETVAALDRALRLVLGL